MIQRISKRFLSLLLVAVMVLALVPAINAACICSHQWYCDRLS